MEFELPICRLFVAGGRAPHLPARRILSSLPLPVLLDELLKIGGTSQKILAALQTIRATAGVVAASAYVHGPVVALSASHTATPVFRGIDVNTVEQVAELQRFRHYRFPTEAQLRTLTGSITPAYAAALQVEAVWGAFLAQTLIDDCGKRALLPTDREKLLREWFAKNQKPAWYRSP